MIRFLSIDEYPNAVTEIQYFVDSDPEHSHCEYTDIQLMNLPSMRVLQKSIARSLGFQPESILITAIISM